jgi:hypothetical protein
MRTAPSSSVVGCCASCCPEGYARRDARDDGGEFMGEAWWMLGFVVVNAAVGWSGGEKGQLM